MATLLGVPVARSVLLDGSSISERDLEQRRQTVSRVRVATKRREISMASCSPRLTSQLACRFFNNGRSLFGYPPRIDFASTERHLCRERDTQPCSGARTCLSDMNFCNGQGDAIAEP